ncbi:MAG: helix-hairpin-helix domain-containing protein [Gaiellaceae bacterium]
MDNMEHLDPRRRTVLVTAAVALVALALAGHFLLGVGAAPEAVLLPPPPTLAVTPLVVHVVGAVRRPGLYRLRQGDRIADAVTRAGGPTRTADLTLVNLAAPVADGTQVVVPRRARPVAAGGPEGSAPEPQAPAGPVHLNTATLEELDALPGVGPVTAQKILDYRAENGAFSSVEELDAISGIGPARLEELRRLVAP